MDIFATVVSAGGIIIKFLSACNAYSDDAESLIHRFNWDLRVINKIIEYFEERRRQNLRHELSVEDEKLLEDTARHLAKLAGKVAGSVTKIQGSGFLQRGRNQVLWITRRSEIEALEAELYDWSSRFDVKLLALPTEFKFVLPASEGSNAPTPPVVRANMRLKEFLALPQKVKDEKIKQILEVKPPAEITRAVANYTLLNPVEVGDTQLILVTRDFPPNVDPSTAEFDKLVSGVGQLAVVLSCLDLAINISLLKVAHYIYDLPTRKFIFAQTVPYRVGSMDTLETLLNRSPFPHIYAPLDQRLRVAYKLAEAVFFLHTAGFVHKNITSLSVAILEKANQERGNIFPFSIGDPYLLGFDVIRTKDMVTRLEGTRTGENKDGIFQHPDRLLGAGSKRYIKNYDIYSLGIVLLQIGLWEPLKIITMGLSDDPVTWREGLLEKCIGIGPRVGAGYQNLVAWCLDLKGDPTVEDVDFIQKVLDPLEDIAKALS
jgi:hypothetical protein